MRIVSYEDMPVTIGKITFLDMWMVTDGENYGIRVRFKGPKRLIMYWLNGFADIKSRSGYVVEQSDGTNIAQYPIKDSRDNHVDKNWKNYTIEKVDYFYLSPEFGDDSIHLISNPFK
ncbi:hypothetical protein D3C74_329010 [compost metagenome]